MTILVFAGSNFFCLAIEPLPVFLKAGYPCTYDMHMYVAMGAV